MTFLSEYWLESFDAFYQEENIMGFPVWVSGRSIKVWTSLPRNVKTGDLNQLQEYNKMSTSNQIGYKNIRINHGHLLAIFVISILNYLIPTLYPT
jgi:hypothetical protein